MNVIGKKVKIKPGSRYEYQAMNNRGDGYGKIEGYDPNFDYDGGLPYEITWNNGHHNSYARKDFDFAEDIDNEPVKVRWYNKGKLVKERKLFESPNDIGKKVKIRDDSDYREQAYEYNGDGYGTIEDFDPDDDHSYIIVWNNKHDNSYRRSDFDFVEDIGNENKRVKTRWYNKGKLSEKLNKIKMDTLNEAKIMGQKSVGKKIKLKADSDYYIYYRMALKEDDIYGTILQYNPDNTHKYKIEFDIEIPNRNNLKIQHLDYKDIEILPDDFKIPGNKIRWYKHGKFLDESEW